jgi:glycosyltransferase involved in cell wall biosynthesis
MLQRVAIDLTPLLPGGENGGAKPLALELVRQLALLRPKTEFVLLTAEVSHAELASLEQSAANHRRVCVHGRGIGLRGRGLLERLRSRAELAAARLLPVSWRSFLRPPYEAAWASAWGHPLRSSGVSLLFCPFTAPFHAEPGVPTVSLMHDLQFIDYPQFFDQPVRQERHRHFQRACEAARRMICPSEFVRGCILSHSSLPPEAVKTIPTSIHRRLPAPGPGVLEALRARLELGQREYFLYPANFWLHKNHELLLTAYGMYFHAARADALPLVLTGAPGERAGQIDTAIRRMGLAGHVIAAGFLPDGEFAALLRGALALVFPSLYEGFGIPVLEAMALGVPVACSASASLPEVAGGAAVLFDARQPRELAGVLARLQREPELRQSLSGRGLERVRSFPTAAQMAERYWDVFREALGGRR